MQVTAGGGSTLLPDGGSGEGEKRGGGDLEMMEEQLPDRNDFGGGDFLEDLGGLGGLEGLGEVPSVGDITLEGGQDDTTTGKYCRLCTASALVKLIET